MFTLLSCLDILYLILKDGLNLFVATVARVSDVAPVPLVFALILLGR